MNKNYNLLMLDAIKQSNFSRIRILFEDLPERAIFIYNSTLYTKLYRQDLDEYGINNVNAVSVFSGGLTYFEPDEEIEIIK